MRRRRRFDVLVQPALPGLFRYAVRLEGDRVRAEDLLQQALATGLQRIEQLQHDGAFRVWMSRIVRNTWLNQRKRKTEDTVEPAVLDNVIALGGPSPEARVDAARLGDHIARALDDLPPDQREAVWLVDGQGFKYAEAAEVLGVAVGTAASRVARGRMALRIALQDIAREQGVAR